MGMYVAMNIHRSIRFQSRWLHLIKETIFMQIKDYGMLKNTLIRGDNYEIWQFEWGVA